LIFDVHSGDSTLDVRRLAFDVQEKQMIDDLAADEVRDLLKLERHATCRLYPNAADDLRAFR